MAKTLKHNKAIKLRLEGKSIKSIAKILNISKSTASVWCKDVGLTQKQIKKLHKDMVTGSYVGRMKGAKLQHERKILRKNRQKFMAKKKLANYQKETC
jgi:transposase